MSFLQLHLAPLLRVCLLLRACRMHNKSISRFCCYPAERSCERNFVSSGPSAVRKDVLSAAASATQLSLSSIYISQTDGQVHIRTAGRRCVRPPAALCSHPWNWMPCYLASRQRTFTAFSGAVSRCPTIGRCSLEENSVGFFATQRRTVEPTRQLDEHCVERNNGEVTKYLCAWRQHVPQWSRRKTKPGVRPWTDGRLWHDWVTAWISPTAPQYVTPCSGPRLAPTAESRRRVRFRMNERQADRPTVLCLLARCGYAA